MSKIENINIFTQAGYEPFTNTQNQDVLFKKTGILFKGEELFIFVTPYWEMRRREISKGAVSCMKFIISSEEYLLYKHARQMIIEEESGLDVKRVLGVEDSFRQHFECVNKDEFEYAKSLLPTSLFPGSKDWVEGNFAERVEWLLLGYKSKKEEVERLEDQLLRLEDQLSMLESRDDAING
jgi:hypothetical protein